MFKHNGSTRYQQSWYSTNSATKNSAHTARIRLLLELFPKARFVTYCTTYPSENQAQEYIDRIVRTFEGTAVQFHLAGSVFQSAKPAPGVTVDVTGGALVQRLF